jgi:hypothetical protein
VVHNLRSALDHAANALATLVSSALAVLIERMGGEITYTQSEFAAIRASRGEYRIEGEADRS